MSTYVTPPVTPPVTPRRLDRTRSSVAAPGAPIRDKSRQKGRDIATIFTNLEDLRSTVSIIATRLSEHENQKLNEEKRINFIFCTYINLLASKKIPLNGLVQNKIESFLDNKDILISIRNNLELVEYIINDVREIIRTLSSAYQHLNQIYNELATTDEFEVMSGISNFTDQRIVLNNVNQRIETLYPQENTRMSIDDRMEAIEPIIRSVRQQIDRLHTVNRFQPLPRR